ncbi:MAG TPA: CDP-alcohol phosphatidyltransferase family protein [Gemmatimonadales bacterium]|nr:CDP-alcohol phosphatidyltransferase family protein [Gemmatimonadales bacterium]
MTNTRPHLTRFSAADALSAVRLPLAVLFVLVDRFEVRLGALVLAALTDLGDGWVARRFGASRIGAVLDPIVDKLFMLAAFGVVLVSGRLAWPEVVAVLLRDIIASAAVLITLLIGVRPATTVPARIGGKAVTLLQLLTLLAFLVESPYLSQLAWATGAVSLYALWDYNRLYFRKLP